MYSVWFSRNGYHCLFMVAVPSRSLAEAIAENIAEEFGFTAWAEED